MPGELRRLRSGRSPGQLRRQSRVIGVLLLIGAVVWSGFAWPASEGATRAAVTAQSVQAQGVDHASGDTDPAPGTSDAIAAVNSGDDRADGESDSESEREATAALVTTEPTDPVTADPGDPATAEIVVAPEDPSIAPGIGQLRLRVLIRSLENTEVPAGTLTVSLELQPSGAAGSDAESGLGGDSQAQRVVIAVVDVSETAEADEQTVSVSVPVSELPLTADTSAPGVYAIHAELRAAEEDADGEDSGDEGADDQGTGTNTTESTEESASAESSESTADSDGTADPSGDDSNAASVDTAPVLTSAQTSIVWRGSQFETALPLSTIVPFLLPASIDTMPSRDDLTAVAPRLNALFTAAERGKATLAIDPRIIAAIRAYGEDAPTAAQDLLARFENTQLSNFLLQFADADPSAQAALGAETLLVPDAIDFLVDPDALDNAGSATGSGSTASPMAISELTKWTHGFAGAWPSEGNTDSSTLRLLQSSGLTTVVLDSRNATVRGGTTFSLEEPGGMTAVVADAALADMTRTAFTAPSDVERDAAKATIAAVLAEAAQLQSPGMVLALDRSAIAEVEDPATFVNWVNSLDWVDATTLDAQTPGTGNLISSFSDGARLELLTQAWSRSRQVVTLAPLLEHPEYLEQYQDLRMLWILGTGFASDAEAFSEAFARQVETDELHLRGVQVVSAVNTQLVGTSTQLPIQLHNSLPFDANVLVHVSPTSAAITVSERLFGPTEVVAGGNSTVLVPVRSRVSSGESALLIQLADAADAQRFVSATLPLTLRTTFEAILFSGLGVFVALLLGFGIWRSIKRRKLRRNNPAVG